MKSKALFLDLDGTLLDDSKQITAGNMAAIREALAAGHRIIITTGRPLVSAIIQAENLQLTGPGCYLIAYNGCIHYDMNARRVLEASALSLPLVYKVFEEAGRRGVHIQTYDESKVLVEPRCDNEIVRLYCSRIKMEHSVIPDIRMLKRAPEKMLLIDLNDREPLNQMRDWVLSWGADQLDLYYSSQQYMEIVAKGINKGTAVLRMAEMLGIDYENTYAAGDEANDISMIQSAHTGIAMANAIAEAKEAADYITENDNNHDGIAEVIHRLILA